MYLYVDMNSLLTEAYFTFFYFCVCILQRKSYKINSFFSIDRGLCYGSGSQLPACPRGGLVQFQVSHTAFMVDIVALEQVFMHVHFFGPYQYHSTNAP